MKKGSWSPEKFRGHVNVAGPDDCWLWTGLLSPKGYGRVNGLRKAHRVMYELVHGPIPAGLGVLHSCDTPACVNPRHLHLGTQQDNLREMRDRGRGKPRMDWAKLTAANAQEIRVRLATGETQRTLASEFEVDVSTISNIHTGKHWKAVH